MVKTTIRVDVPDSVLEAAARKELEDLRKEVTKLRNRVAVLESREKQIKEDRKEIERIRQVWDDWRIGLADTFDLCTERCDDCY